MKNRNFQSLPRSLFQWSAQFCLLIVLCIGCLPKQARAAEPTIYATSFAITGSPLDPNFSTLYRIDAITGVPTLIGAIGFSSVSGIDFDASGNMYGVGQRLNPIDVLDRTPVLLRIDPNTGAGTQVAAITLASNGLNLNPPIQDISFRNSDGALFAYVTGDTYVINKATGVATLVGNSGIAAPPQGGATAFTPTDALVTVSQTLVLTTNQTTGRLLNPPGFTTYPEASSYATGMDFDNTTGKLWATVTIDPPDLLHGVNYLANIDLATGIVTRVGALEGDLGFQGLTVAPSPAAVVPEPGSALVGLLAIGICFTGLFSRNRRETAA